ncbi:hypothetical protein EX895_003422 [Sporisorium graminicola]|uniref:Vacuolar-sorting protein SNF7 n=1 Tax=Sporisorium graminicola TaxID=280036 RepID=A0A4U7KTI7_9BASI|nr:hypothetical protein EX895_003422 [Sporisorium graminicola]TKY87841.1 hypothetical protein EX895_003422 [Sporisorium graminicola]
MSPGEFQTQFSAVCVEHFHFSPSARDADLVLTYLSRDHSPRLAVRQSGIIKLSGSEAEPVDPITDEDRSVIAVKETLRKLDLQITSLEARIAHRNTQIREALRSPSNKVQAASYLRSRKALEEVLAKRTGIRDTLSGVVAKIEQAKTDVDVMRAYKASSDVLRSVLRSDELQVDNVDKVMDGLAEVVAEQREVDEAMRVGAGGAVVEEVDEDEIMDELRVLEAEKRQEEERENQRDEQAKKEDIEREAQKLRESKEHEELQARFDRLRVAQSPLSTPSNETGTESGKQNEAADHTAIAE